uniref:CCHC-type domain-containing protein n=1 Tax=Tanacetum cinerariifolium TaxID=118510 RepID=A0A6L2JWS3_TANCI|nr:hypothetical protein [Tanacetum cinerariifolium]
MQVNVQFLQQLQPEWSWFVTIVKQQHKLDEVAYHKLFDILKQYQNEVNELHAEKLARNANPLALVATAQASQDPFYQTSRSHRSSAPSSKPSIPSRSHMTTRHKGKEIAKPITPPSETASEEDSYPKQAQRDKDMQKNLALISKYFKKIYKPTNNNLRTSSNSKNKNVDTTLRENVGSKVVQQSGIQCFNCREFGHFAKECRKPKRLADTDEEVDEQELEAHYSYMAKIQEVPTADSDSESVEQTKQAEFEKFKAFNDRTIDYDKLERKLNDALGQLAHKDTVIREGLKTKAYEISVVKEKHDELMKQSLLTKSHYEGLVKQKTKVPTYNGRPTFANPRYLKQAQSKIPCMYTFPYNQSTNANRLIPDREETLALERGSRSKLNKDSVRPYDYTKLNSLYEIFKLPTQDYETQLAHTNEIRRKMWPKSFVKSKPKIYKNVGFLPVLKSISKSRQAYNVMTNNINHFKQIVDDAWIKHSKDLFRALTAHDMEILIQRCLMPLAIKTQSDSFKFVHELKQEMHADLKYVESLEKEIDELESDKVEFSDMYDVILQECVSKDVVCSYLMSLSDLDALDELQCLYLHKVKECDCLAQKLSKQTESISKKEREQYFKIQDLKAQLQDQNIATSELKKLIEMGKGKSMDTKFDRPSVARQPNAQRIPKPSVLGKPIPFLNSLDIIYFQKTRSVSKANMSEGLSKPVTAQTLPQTAKKAVSNTNVLKPGMYRIDNRTPHTRAPQLPQTVRNTNPRVLPQFLDMEIWFKEMSRSTGLTTSKDSITISSQLVNFMMQIWRLLSGSLHVLLEIFRATPTQAWLWHQRLSHLNFDCINLLLKKDIVIGLYKLKYVKDQLCPSCELSKAKRSSFKSKAVPSLKGRLNLLYMDLCGPMRVASINGKKYILVSDYDNPDPVPQRQYVSSLANADVPSQQELDLLFSPLYDEFFNAGSNPSTNVQSTSATSTHTNVHAEENNNDQAKEGEQIQDDEFTNLFYADHAGCIDSRKSTSGGIQFLVDKLVSWMSKKQNCTAMLSAEAEYVALSASCAQVITEYQLADMFTKALPEDRFKYLVRRIGMRCLTSAELEVLAKESA